MNKLLKHITQSSRLIYIYLLTIVVSGSILTYLSIESISNFTELTEKRILEEEKRLHDLYSDAFRQELVELGTRIVSEASMDSLNPASLVLTDSLISDYIVMNIDGVFHRPRQVVLGDFEMELPNFSTNFKLGQQQEFSKKNFKQARYYYGLCLNFARNKADSAKVINAIGRSFFSNNEFEDATLFYHTLLRSYPNSSNLFGMPYVNFAMNQLLQMKDRVSADEMIALQQIFVEGLLKNSIPFNPSTSSILQNIKINNEESSLDSLVDKVLQRILLTQKYASILTNANAVKNDSWKPLGSLMTYNTSNDPEALLLRYNTSLVIVGILTSLQNIHLEVSKSLKIPEMRFKYKFSVSNSFSESFNESSDEVLQGTFSNHFNDAYLQIWPKDSKKISDYIFRRKLTNIVGLILLLVAMGIGFVTLIQDVNRKKKMEKLRADFVANVTHELKTPLTSINMFADSIVLERVKNEKDLKKYAHIIVKESEKLKRMINNILDFSRKESNKLNVNLREENLTEVINEIMEEMNYWLEIHGFEVYLDLDDSMIVSIDKEGIKQVLSNLITNAIKYSPNTKKIVIRSYFKAEKVFIEVKDNSIGIAEDKQKNIFDKFYRVQRGTSESISGTGLGLTVSKDIVQAHHGVIRVQSTVGQGSTFIIELKRES